jgi:hypothetical protein
VSERRVQVPSGARSARDGACKACSLTWRCGGLKPPGPGLKKAGKKSADAVAALTVALAPLGGGGGGGGGVRRARPLPGTSRKASVVLDVPAGEDRLRIHGPAGPKPRAQSLSPASQKESLPRTHAANRHSTSVARGPAYVHERPACTRAVLCGLGAPRAEQQGRTTTLASQPQAKALALSPKHAPSPVLGLPADRRRGRYAARAPSRVGLPQQSLSVYSCTRSIFCRQRHGRSRNSCGRDVGEKEPWPQRHAAKADSLRAVRKRQEAPKRSDEVPW